MDGESLVHAVKAKDARGLKITATIQVPGLRNGSSSDQCARNSPDARLRTHRAYQCLDDQPFPSEGRCRIRSRRVAVNPLAHQRADCDGGQETYALHALADSRHELRRQLIGDLIEAHRVKSALAGRRRVVSCEKRERHIPGPIVTAAYCRSDPAFASHAPGVRSGRHAIDPRFAFLNTEAVSAWKGVRK